jgi:hypothetical protein
MGTQENEEGKKNEGLFTEAQRDEMIKFANAANSAHHARISKVMDQRFDELKTEMSGSFQEMLKDFKPSDPPSGGTNGSKEGNGESTEIVEKLRAEYEARMSEMEKKWEAERKRGEEERLKALRAEERGELESALRSAGVADERLRGAVALLYTEDKRVGRDKDGKIVFRVPKEGYTDELSLSDGITEWIKTNEGKHYMPARPVGGSGAMGGRGAKGQIKESRAELMAKLGRQLMGAEE